MPSFSAVWSEIQKLLPQGLSIIPVRDKADEKYAAKTPYPKWKEYQNRQILEHELYNQLETFNTGAIAIICGKISGNLEVIDVDVKNYPGIDAVLFDEIKTLYPNIWHSLRIHRSPSGGYHILYKVLGEVPGNKKLAGRETTEQEKENYSKLFPDKKRPLTEVNFIETRGEGGYVLAPPSMGYSVFKDGEIPVLTWEERCSIIAICTSLNRIQPKPKQEPKQAKNTESFYEENPFQDYNNRCDLLALMQNHGWSFVRQKGTKIWLTKPGGKSKHVHAAIFTDSNLFYCFTTGTDFISQQSYRPSAVLAFLQFNDDWKQCYKFLVDNGYGKIKKKIEDDLIRTGRELPANASEEAKRQKIQHEKQQQEVHPYGIFWEWDENDKLHISRERLYTVAYELGFRLYKDDIVRIVKPFVHRQTERQFFDALKEYIKEEDGDVYEDICNAYEAFLQKSGRFTAERIQFLDETLLLLDDRNTCYKFFANHYLKVTADEIKTVDYATEERLILHEKVQPRDYSKAGGGVYPEFLKLATGEITLNLRQTVGYLAHEYKDETTGYIIVLTEKVADPKRGGGSGKNLFCQLFEHTTTFTSRPGAGAKFDEKFFQSWNKQKIFLISDVDEKFDFLFLKEPATGNILWKKLFKDETSVASKDSPKLIVNTNYSFEVSDGGLARRIKPIEFTDYFTLNGGVDVVFNKHFTDDWTDEDWNGYDTFISESVQIWLQSNRKLQTQDLSDTGWEKQFKQAHKITIWNLIQEFWPQWIKQKDVPNDVFKQQLTDYYNQESIPIKYHPTTFNINKALSEYAAKQRVDLRINVSMRQSNGFEGKGRKFIIDDEEAPF